MSITHTNIDIRETHTIGGSTREWLVSAALCPALVPHEITLVGLTEADADFCFIRLDPPGSQLLACTGGAGWVWIDSGWERCEAGQVYVTPPGVFHAYHSDKANPWSLCWVQSSGDWLGIGDKPLLLSAEIRPLAEAISGLHREVMHSAEPGLLPPWAFLVSSYSRRLVRPAGGDPRLRLLWESVNADLVGPWTVEELARRVGLSQEHLRRLCHAHLAVSPMRHVTALRMRRAAAFLASESYSVEAVARLVGYDSPYAFSTAFKRHMGMPPSEYRQGKPRDIANR
jgi:AraC-like DNA-binding protein